MVKKKHIILASESGSDAKMFLKFWIRILYATLAKCDSSTDEFESWKVSLSYQQNLYLRPYIKNTRLTP